MDVRTAASPKDVKHYTTDRLREEFLIQDLFQADKINLVYSHIDRIITGAAVPVNEKLDLTAGDELRAEYFLQRREMGLINIGGDGIVTVDGRVYEINARDGMYIGRGSKDISFESKDASNPAKFYLNSCPAHTEYPTVHIKLEGEPEEGVVIVKDENKVEMGTLEENTMPAHTHDRRMEVYLYFDMDDDAFVVHYMGEPQETRHIIMHNEEAVISPSWSIHSGSGSRAYTFIWGMCGENQDYGDMDNIDNKDLR